MKMNSLPWWRSDDYSWDTMMVPTLHDFVGPEGLALVRVYPDGRTQTGWGRDAFMKCYKKTEFAEAKAAYRYRTNGYPFAIVMRSLRVIAIDIDGKNGGLEGALKLGNLPYTLSETSKSGNGYHLFYSVEDEWDVDFGFDRFSDHIGVEQGVDIRATGCIYHHNTQRWNGREIAPLPEYLADMLLAKKNKRGAMTARIETATAQGDEFEMLMIHEELRTELKKPVADGKRNNTLFAIGTKMVQAGLETWQKEVSDRAMALGLDSDEVGKLTANIARYAAK